MQLRIKKLVKRFLKVLEVSVNLVCVVSNIVLLPDLNPVQRNRSTLTVSHLGPCSSMKNWLSARNKNAIQSTQF